MRCDLVTRFVEDPHPVADWCREHFGLVTLEETEQFVRLDGGEGAKVAFHVGEPVGNPRHVQLHVEVVEPL